MLTGDRIRLRALEPTDVDPMHAWYRDHEFSVLDGNIYGTSRDSLAAFVATLTSPSFADVSLGIEDEHGTLIGIVRLKRVRPEDRVADFGIAIARDYWSRGYGTDATRTILRFAFDTMNLHRRCARRPRLQRARGPRVREVRLSPRRQGAPVEVPQRPLARQHSHGHLCRRVPRG